MLLTKRPLAANETYEQPGRDRFEGNDPVGGVRGLVYASHAGTLYLEESDDDGATWSQAATVSVSAKKTTALNWASLTKQQYRFRYVNGGTKQTKFRLTQQTRGMEIYIADLSSVSIPDTNPVPTNEIGSGMVLIKGITTQDGSPSLFVDASKDFKAGALVGQTAKLTIGDIDYYRSVTSNTGPGIGINPIQEETAASAKLTGTATQPNGEVVVNYVTAGEEGNVATIQLVDNVSGVPNQPMTGVLSLENGVHLVITSATQGVDPGASLGFTATDVAGYINDDTDSLGLSSYFSAVATETGQIDATPEPVPFTGGQDAVIVPAATPYEIIAGKTRLVGDTVLEQLTEADADVDGVLSFAENIVAIRIHNTDTENAGVFNVNGINITLPPSTPATPSIYEFIVGAPGKTVTITGATTYTVSRCE